MKKLIFLLIIPILFLVSCNEANLSAHTHEFSTIWSKNENFHFHECMGCNIVSDKANHIYDDGVLLDNGGYKYTCTVCGYSYQTGGNNEVHQHQYKAEWSYDDECHWHDCYGCTLVNKEKHEYDQGKVILEPTQTSYGIKRYTCLYCGYTKDESIPKLPHEHRYTQNDYAKDENYHYPICNICNEKLAGEEHTFEPGRLLERPTVFNTGKQEYVCSICSYCKTVILPVLEHVHEAEYRQVDDSKHARVCKICNETLEYESHNIIEGQDTLDAKVIFTYDFCNICGYKTNYKYFDEDTEAMNLEARGTGIENAIVVVHYHRETLDYADWYLWVWGDKGSRLKVTSADSFGVYYKFDLGDPSKDYYHWKKVGFIVHQTDWTKDIEEDRFIMIEEKLLNDKNELHIYLYQGDPNIYSSPSKEDKLNQDIPSFTISFYGLNDTFISSEYVGIYDTYSLDHYFYNHQIPNTIYDGDYTYVFAGWDKKNEDLVQIQENIIVRAKYYKILSSKLGLYPRSIVNDGYLRNALDGLTPDSNMYVYYEGKTYFKIIQNSYTWGYYEVEPIRYMPLQVIDNKLYLISNEIVDIHIFDESSSNYLNSSLRTWLNNDFLNTAFKDKSLLLDIRNGDKIVIPNGTDMTTLQLSGINIMAEYTAFLIYGRNHSYGVYYWLDYEPAYNDRAYYFSSGITTANITASNVGVRIIICIDLNKI